MVPSTSLAGTEMTPIISPVNVSTLTRMLNPRPKNALVSPRVHHGMDSAGASSGFSVGESAGGSVTSWDMGRVLSGGVGGDLLERRDERGGVGDPSEDAALRLDHLQADALELGEVRTDAIGYDEALVSSVVGLTGGGVHAHLGGDPGDQQLGDARLDEHVLQLGGVERALARLVDDDLAIDGRQFVHDVVSVLTTDEDATVLAFVPNAFRRGATAQLGGRAVGQVGLVPFAGVDHQDPGLAGGGDQRCEWGDDLQQLVDVVAEARAETAGQQEVALHVDDDQRGLARLE